MIVPTVLRGLLPVDFCAIEIDGLNPLTKSTSRLGHLPHELPGVVRKRLDVAALPFGIERIECERRFPAPGHTRKANQFATRQSQIDVTQIVLAGTFDPNFGRRHSRNLGQTKKGSPFEPSLAVRPIGRNEWSRSANNCPAPSFPRIRSLESSPQVAVDMRRRAVGDPDCTATIVKTGPGKTEICLPRNAARGNGLPPW